MLPIDSVRSEGFRVRLTRDYHMVLTAIEPKVINKSLSLKHLFVWKSFYFDPFVSDCKIRLSLAFQSSECFDEQQLGSEI